MLRTCALLLPALFPSWRFFKTVAPSPRLQFRLITKDGATGWRESHPRPAVVSFGQMMGRLFWNPQWNEQLFLVSCAERLDDNPTQHSIDEINKRIARVIRAERDEKLQFRILFVQRQGAQIVTSIDYESDPVPLQLVQS